MEKLNIDKRNSIDQFIISRKQSQKKKNDKKIIIRGGIPGGSTSCAGCDGWISHGKIQSDQWLLWDYSSR